MTRPTAETSVEPERRASGYRLEGSSRLIEIELRDLRQLFNTLDPAPFHERDLDPEAESYIVDALREIGSARRWLRPVR